MSFFGFIESVLSEDGTTGSYSRCASAFIVFFTVLWITFLVFKNKTMPDLGPAMAFMSAGVGVHMGINKASQIASAVTGSTPALPKGSTPIPSDSSSGTAAAIDKEVPKP